MSFSPPAIERRSRQRVNAAWPVSVSINGTPWVTGATGNLSCNSFYCVLSQFLAPGQEVDCRLSIPDPAAPDSDEWIQLLCRARVVRVEAREHGFGVGCTIEDFLLVGSER